MRFIARCVAIVLPALASVWAGMALAAPAPQASDVASAPVADIELFVREGCPYCVRAEAFLARLEREQPALRLVIRDVAHDPAALARLQRIAREHNTAARVPSFVVGGDLIVGFSGEDTTGRFVRDALARVHPQAAAAPGCEVNAAPSCEQAVPATPAKPQPFSVELLGHTVTLDQVGLPLFTLTLGLLDGFNPCSMWVLILMISLLAPMRDRPRMLAIAGTFVAVQGIVYFAFMAAWLNLFLLIGLSRISEIVIAALALVAGAINLKDFWRYGWGVSLSIPAAAKPGIYARMRGVLQARNLAGALAGIVVLGLLVQIVELMCTSGFPALFTRILTLQQLDRTAHYAYLLLYDAAYMLDDVIVLAIGVITLSQRRLQENEGRWLKLASGLAMVGLGAYLIWR